MEPGGGAEEPGGESGCFLYYAYGSNLLRQRLLLRNPSAAFCALARLQVVPSDRTGSNGHKLNNKKFHLSLRKNFALRAEEHRNRLPGEILEPPSLETFKTHVDTLLCHLLEDFKLEFGHHQGRTSSIWHGGTATIVQSPGDEVWGIVWKMNTCNLSSLDKQEGVEDGIYVPIEVNVHTQAGKVLTCRSYQMKDYVCGPPSPQYKKVICMGAKQNGLPTDYLEKLEAIETNNYAGPVPIMEEIEAAIKAEKIYSA